MAKIRNYPEWKKTVWRFVRVAVAGGLAVLATNLLNLEFSPTVGAIIRVFLTGAVAAVTKYVRGKDPGYETLVHKLPV